MGWNTTFVVLNDYLHELRKKGPIGEIIADQAAELNISKNFRGYHSNAIQPIETHHADDTAVIFAHGNTARTLSEMSDEELIDALKWRLQSRGLNIVRLPRK